MSPADAALAIAPAPALPFPAPAPAPSRPAPRRRDVERVLADLHERHEAELSRFCRWMLKDAEDAADAVQDTWIRAMGALGDGRVRVAAHRPWLFAIARNVCLDRLRERKRASVHEADESAFGDTPGADEVVAIRQEADAALALVGSLSERQRSALLMRELAGMSVPDIAAALGLSVDRAHWTIADARRALDEARAGSSLACEEARTRVGAGHRGRTLRAHLSTCAECRAHDRRLRTKRLLAPAFVPWLWIKRLLLPVVAVPATAATVATLSLPALAPIGPAPDVAAPQTRAPSGEAPGIRRASAPRAPRVAAAPDAAATGRTRAAAPAPTAEPGPAPNPVPATAPVAEPAPEPAASAAAPPRPAVRTLVAAAAEPVRRTVDAVAPVVEAAPQLVQDTVAPVAQTATTVLDTLR